jgi:hypothetical protein
MLRHIPQNALVVNLHTLRHVFGNPNRGENNEPKTVYLGGVLRSHVSYQSYNAAMREKLRERLPNSWFGNRTGKIKELIIRRGQGKLPDDELRQVATAIGIGFRGKEKSKSKDEDKTQMLLLGMEEADQLVEKLVAMKADMPADYKSLCDPLADVVARFTVAIEKVEMDDDARQVVVEKAGAILNHKKLKSLTDLKDVTVLQNISDSSDEDIEQWAKAMAAQLENADVATKWVGKASGGTNVKEIQRIMATFKIDAPPTLEKKLFGSFCTNKETFPVFQSSLTTIGSVGVVRYHESVDFFSCVDDLDRDGAGHIQSRIIHSDLGYECSKLVMNDYLGNGANKAEAAEVVEAIIYATENLQFIGGRKYGGNQHPPVFMMAEVIPNNNAFSHVTAFAKTITPDRDGVDALAIKQLAAHARRVNKGRDMQLFGCCTNPDYSGLIPDDITMFDNYSDFGEAVRAATEKKLEAL